MFTKLIPRVGVGVILIKNETILLGKRKNSHGAATWAPPGGHLEFGESWQDCAKREVLEETGIQISNILFYAVTNDIFIQENKHYLTLFMITETFTDEPKIMEPEKCEFWSWFSINELPENLFLPLKNLIVQKSNFKETLKAK